MSCFINQLFPLGDGIGYIKLLGSLGNDKELEEIARKLHSQANSDSSEPGGVFNHCYLSFEIKMPIFVFRQWSKPFHDAIRITNLPVDSIEFYVLSENKTIQEYQRLFCEQWKTECFKQIQDGLAPEDAMITLPCNAYIKFMETGNLYGYSWLYQGINEGNAMGETKEYAKSIKMFLSKNFPKGWEALNWKK